MEQDWPIDENEQNFNHDGGRRRGRGRRGRGGSRRNNNKFDRGSFRTKRTGNDYNQQRGNRSHEHNNQPNNNFQNQERDSGGFGHFPKFRDSEKNWTDDKSSGSYYSKDETGRKYSNQYEEYKSDYIYEQNYNEPLLGYYEFLTKYYPNESFNELTPLDQSKDSNQDSIKLPNPMTEALNIKIKKEKVEEKNFNKANEVAGPVELPKPQRDNSNIKIKQEEKEEKKSRVETESTSSSSSSSSSSDSDTGEKKKELVEKIIKNDTSKSEKSKKNKKGIMEKQTSKSSTSSSDDTTSESSEGQMTKKSKKNIKKTSSKSEEEVICLGNLEKFEDLVGDEQEKIERKCVLCDKKGHTSFFCQMICKNCGDNYHNAKMCSKPANLSRMLQVFMEFNMSQCLQYDPERRFSYRNGNVQTELLPGVFPPPFSDSGISKKRLRSKTSSDLLNLSKSKKIRYDSSESSSSSSSGQIESKTKRNKKKQNNNLALSDIQNQTNPGLQFNPLMAQMMAQMMGISSNFLQKQ